MNSQLNKVLATGGWYSKKDCPDSPKRLVTGEGIHFFKDISVKMPSMEKERRAGVRLITSQCKYCGGLIVDCPTIGLSAFTL